MRKLDRTIQVQSPTPVDDDFGHEVSTFENYHKFRANRTDVNDSERLSAQQVNSSLVTRFIITSSEKSRAIDPTYQIIHDGKTFAIKGIKETKEKRRRYLEITAEAKSDEPSGNG